MSEKTPVRLLNRRLGCQNSVFQVFLDDIETEDGEVVKEFLVLVPKRQSKFKVTGVAVLPILDGDLALLRIYRHAIGDFVWELPRGFVESGEEDIQSAGRELEEETGLECDPEHIVDLGTMACDPGVITGRTRLFVAKKCRIVRAFQVREMGHMEFRVFGKNEVHNMVLRGEIEDPTTLIAYYRFFSHGENENLGKI